MFKIYSSIGIALFLLIGTAHASIRLRVPRAAPVKPPRSPVTPPRSSALPPEPLATAGGVSVYRRPSHPTALSPSEFAPSLQNTGRATGPMNLEMPPVPTHSAGGSASGSARSYRPEPRRRQRLKDTTRMSESDRAARRHRRAQQQREQRALQAQLTRVKRGALAELQDIQLTPQRRNLWFSGIDERSAKDKMALMLIAHREGISTDIIRGGMGTVTDRSKGAVTTSITPTHYNSIRSLYWQIGIRFERGRKKARNIFDRRLFVASIKQGNTPEKALEHIIKGRFLEKKNMRQQDIPQALGLSAVMPSLEEVLRTYEFRGGIGESILTKHADEVLELLEGSAQRKPIPQTAILAVFKEQYQLTPSQIARGQNPVNEEQLSTWFKRQRPEREPNIVGRTNHSGQLINTIKSEHWHMDRLVRYHRGEGRRFAPTKAAAISAPELHDVMLSLVRDHQVGGQWVTQSLERGGFITHTFPETVKVELRKQGIRSGKKGDYHLQNAAITTWFADGVGEKGPRELLEFVRGLGSANHYQKIVDLADNLQGSMGIGLRDYGLSAEVVARYATRDSRQEIPRQAVAHWWDKNFKQPGVHKPVSRPNNKIAHELFENPGRDRHWTLAELVGPATPLTRK